MKKILLTLAILINVMMLYAQVQEAWVKTYSYNSESQDHATVTAVDASGNIYVSGASWRYDDDDEEQDLVVTIKYDKNGNELWRRTYGGGGFINRQIRPMAMALDPSGNVHIVATIAIYNRDVFVTLKYAANGTFRWANRFPGITDFRGGEAADIAVDGTGNVFVTGYVQNFEGEYGFYTTLKYDIDGNQQWLRLYNGASPGNGTNEAAALALDASGNVYITGMSQLNGQLDYATVKYNSAGSELWVRRYGVTNGSDVARDITADQNGNIYVTGISYAGNDEYDIATVKYDADGNLVWERRFDGGAHDLGRLIKVDGNSDVIVAGHSKGGGFNIDNYDYRVIKYNTSGDQLWTSIYNGPNDATDRPTDMTLDAENNIYLTGRSDNYIATVRFKSDGSQNWAQRYGIVSQGFFYSEPQMGVTVDALGNVYVAANHDPASSDPADFATIRYSQCNILCPADITVNNEPGKCGTVVQFNPASYNGDCGSSFTYSHNTGIEFPVGTTTVTVTSDATGASCSFDITVVDNQNPVITCPNNITVNTDPGVCYASAGSVNAIPPGATDNCSPVGVTGVRSDGASLGANYPAGITTITWTATDPSNNTATCSQTITVIDNVPPDITNTSVSQAVLSPPNHKMIDIYLGYTVTDNCGATTNVTVTSDEPETGLSNGDLGPDIIKINNNHWQLRAERDGKGDGRIYTLLITATDGSGNTSTATETVVVAHNIGSPHSGHAVRVGSTVSFSGTFWDVPGSKHTAKWFVDDKAVKASLKEPSGMRNGTVTGSYRFTAPGVYKLRMEITDQNGTTTTTSTNDDLEAIIVVYDPNGGYTYGGGYFASPAGALRSDPLAKGDAGFGFTINYYKTATMPKGETQFDFKVGSFEYNALNFDYLVISNSMAQFRGTGKIIGGQSGIEFIMTVIDGKLDGTGIDKVRMKIYNKNTNEIYYDNQPGASDAALPVMPVGDQSDIVIAGSKAPVTRRQEDLNVEETNRLLEKLTVIAYPNPYRRQFNLSIHAPVNGIATIEFFDLSGARVHTERKPVTAGINTFHYPALHRYGNLLYKVSIGDQQLSGKLIKPE